MSPGGWSHNLDDAYEKRKRQGRRRLDGMAQTGFTSRRSRSHAADIVLLEAIQLEAHFQRERIIRHSSIVK